MLDRIFDQLRMMGNSCEVTVLVSPIIQHKYSITYTVMQHIWLLLIVNKEENIIYVVAG